MAKTTTTERKPTEQQAMLIRLATRKKGVTRSEVREALGYEEGQNIPVQTILKNIATRFGYKLVTDEVKADGSNRWLACYGFERPAAAAVSMKRAPKKTAAAKK